MVFHGLFRGHRSKFIWSCMAYRSLPEKQAFCYRLFNDIVALFIAILLTPWELKSVDYIFHDWPLKFFGHSAENFRFLRNLKRFFLSK